MFADVLNGYWGYNLAKRWPAIVEKQRVLRGIDLSDHCPVVANLAVKSITAVFDKLVHGRSKLLLTGKVCPRMLRNGILTCQLPAVKLR
ncbi:putative transposable element encoded protein [Trachipleistophora hominis]|uniref:Putative transposable element encoded protein n=1 Tax=Trachipleistophora hominis TaxID=72359 RepID=L7K0G5_TRAHO|nr:putative transposable element encoded protein [Trachipleistophora hominis]